MFENLKFGPGGSEYLDEEDEYVKIWEKIDDSRDPSSPNIVAVTIAKSSGASWIQIHPEYRFLERELVEWLEKQVTAMGHTEIRFMVEEIDEERQVLLSGMGYENLHLESYYRIRPPDAVISEYQLPEGFTIRHVDIMEDFVKYRDVQGSVFKHMKGMTEKLAETYRKASFYIPELDLVAVAPDESFAAFCTVRLDPVSKIAEFEPVGTHPDYRKLGLGKSLLLEGLKRLEKYNPALVCIQGAAPSEAANRLYDSIGLTEKTAVHEWYKKF
jgi:GNAT superfamily N-acetyltransferase